MANLIIKSSADNLVLQGSDASPAITVGATGTTTFAENATFSGTANNLGTTTAGTLSSGVTFPAGHVLQTVIETNSTETSTTSTSFAEVNAGLSPTITPSATSSKILIMASSGGYITATYYLVHTMYRTRSGESDVNLGNGTWGQALLRNQADTGVTSMGIVYLDSPNTDQALTYKLMHRVTGGTGYTNINASQGNVVLMEIKG